uniref:ATPase subunit 6 n=1 Tax=Polylabroides guangdongensis TaxID=1131911 RepID=A0A3G0WS64_9PLAT|nr:ATPase subunit 6 [Polylabroides guangdongensis]
MSRFNSLLFNFNIWQSFHYSYFTFICASTLIISQVPYIWSFSVIYVVIPLLMGVRPLGLALYNLLNFIKILVVSVPKELPSVAFSVVITPFIFIGECCSQMLRPITLLLRLLVNLTFAYLVSLTVASQFVEKFISFNLSFKIIIIYCFSVFYFFLWNIYGVFANVCVTCNAIISDKGHVSCWTC